MRIYEKFGRFLALKGKVPYVTIFSGADRLVYPTQLGSSDMIRAYKEQMKTTDLPYRILFENF